MKRPILLLSMMLDQGGSERQLTEMALALDRSRYTPHVAAFRANGMRADELRAAGVPVLDLRVLSFRSRGALAGAWSLARYIRRHRIELAHSFDAPSTVFATPVVHFLTRAAMVSSQRGHRGLTPEYRRLLRWTDRLVDGVVVNCEYLQRHLMEDEGVPQRLIRVCYNGLDLSRFGNAPLPRPEALAGARLVIGTLCVLRPEKGLYTLLEAFAQLAPRERGLRLAIVGSGPEREGLMARAAALGVAGECVFQPATSEVGQWLGAMDVFVMPSYDEAFSNAIMEAMACGCAVAASDVGGNPELVAPDRGLLVPPRDAAALATAIGQLLADEALRARLACAARAFVRDHLSREKAAARLADIYDGLLEDSSHRP